MPLPHEPRRVNVLAYIARRDVGRQARLLALVTLGVLLGLAPIHLVRVVLDRVIPARDTWLLGRVGALLLALVVARAVVGYAQGVVSEQVRQGFLGGFRAELFAHLLRVSPDFYSKRSVGQLMNQVQLDVGRLGMSVAWIFIEPLVHAVTVALYAAYLVTIDPRLTLLALCPLPAVVMLVPRLNARLADNGREFTREIGAYAAAMQESFSAIFEVQTHGTWRWEELRLAHLQSRVSKNRVDEARYNAWLTVLSDVSRGVGPVLVYTWGAVLAMRGELSAGRIVAFTGALGGMYLAVDKLIKYPPLLQTSQDRFDELWEFFSIPKAFEEPARQDVSRARGDAGVEVALDDVSFVYDPRAPVLQGLTITFRAGEHVALVGRSGCGKSTVLGLAAARLAPTGGEVTLGGQRARDHAPSARTRWIGYVGQHPFLFNSTLRHNLLYALMRHDAADGASPERFVDLSGNRDARLVAICEDVGLGEDLFELGLRAQVKSADAEGLLGVRAELARALAGDALALTPVGASVDPSRWHDELSVRDNLLFGRPDPDDAPATRRVLAAIEKAVDAAGLRAKVLAWGLDFEVGERGARLSGGQRQKVSIARVLLKDPELLLLDEVSASLDQRSASKVHALIAERFRGRTVLTVTHQFGGIERFDRVVMFDKGSVVEDGAPEALLAAQGPFRALYDAAAQESEKSP